MKLVIDIPEEFYKELMNGSDIEICCGGHFIVTDSWASDVMRNGKPLDNVFDEIKTEITQEITYKPMEMWDYRIGLTRAFEIIDRYKEEREE